MKNLAQLFFCIFTVSILISCEPEEISKDIDAEISLPQDLSGETGDQKDVKQEVDED